MVIVLGNITNSSFQRFAMGTVLFLLNLEKIACQQRNCYGQKQLHSLMDKMQIRILRKPLL